MTGTEAGIDPIALPGILAYRDGKQFACLVPLVDYLPDEGELDEEMVEKIFTKYVFFFDFFLLSFSFFFLLSKTSPG